MTPMADSVSSRLTRHFFSSLFDFGFLSDAGVQSFTRLILGVYGVFLALLAYGSSADTAGAVRWLPSREPRRVPATSRPLEA